MAGKYADKKDLIYMEETANILGQEVHFATRLPIAMKLEMVYTVVEMTTNVDQTTGTVEVIRGFIPIVTSYAVMGYLTDMALDEIGEDVIDKMMLVYDATHDGLSENFKYPFERFYWDIFNAVMTEIEEMRYQAEQNNSIGAQFKSIADIAKKDDASRDLGMIRKMLTDAVIKKENKENREKREGVDGKAVVDFSAFKPKEPKK